MATDITAGDMMAGMTIRDDVFAFETFTIVSVAHLLSETVEITDSRGLVFYYIASDVLSLLSR